MKTALSLVTLLAVATLSLPASAHGTWSAQPALQAPAKAGAVMILARRGADDPASHDQFDDKGGNRPDKGGKGGKGRGGHDDGPNHA